MSKEECKVHYRKNKQRSWFPKNKSSSHEPLYKFIIKPKHKNEDMLKKHEIFFKKIRVHKGLPNRIIKMELN